MTGYKGNWHRITKNSSMHKNTLMSFVLMYSDYKSLCAISKMAVNSSQDKNLNV